MSVKIVNALSFDVEDWYMGIEIGAERWGEFEKRLNVGLEYILSALEEKNVKATFFVLGKCAEYHPGLIRNIAAAGHEIATHGLSHTKIYEMTPETFGAELKESISLIEDATGKKVIGHRAPYFSITEKSLWAIDVLRKNGIRYDSSVYPGANYRYGIDGAPEHPYLLDKFDFPEFPVSVGRLRGKKFGLGGAYFRILPYFLTKKGIREINAGGHPAVFYLHPWEFDPRHPRVEFPRKAHMTHYFNLKSTRKRFLKLLNDFSFAPMAHVLREQNLL